MKGCTKLRKVEFALVSLAMGEVLRFYQGVSKNWCIDIMSCFVDHHRLVEDCLIDDVISTFKELAWHCPIDWLTNKPCFHPLFPCPRPKWKMMNEVWFTTSLVGWNQLWLIVDILTFDFLSFKDKVLFNKSERGMGITCMDKALVPKEYGMEVIRTPFHMGNELFVCLLIKFLAHILDFILIHVLVVVLSNVVYTFVCLFCFRYNHFDKCPWDKTMQCIINGELKDTCLLQYDETFN